MADAKHYSAYNQETARYLVDQVISAGSGRPPTLCADDEDC